MSDNAPYFVINIEPLTKTDDYAVIFNQNYNAKIEFTSLFLDRPLPLDLGAFFRYKSMSLNNSIINLSVASSITFNLSVSEDIPSRVFDFCNTLSGRKITVQSTINEITTTEFTGFIGSIKNGINLRSGTQFTIPVFTLLAQLNKLTSNGSWDDSMRKYKNVFTTLSGNLIEKDILFGGSFEGSLLEGSKVIYLDGAFSPLPNKLWAVIVPSKSRLTVIREILIAYSRIIYQDPDGTVIVKALSIDDMCDDVYNIDLDNNDYASWIETSSSNSAIELNNRIDVTFAVDVPFNQFGAPDKYAPPNIYATCPVISKDNKVTPQTSILSYTEIYKTSTRLYNSGKWCMPDQRNVSLGNNILLDTILANLLIIPYEYSAVKYSANDKYNSLALFYAQLYMAEVNTANYNATIQYNYVYVKSSGFPFDSPLSQIVNIKNCTDLDYPNNLVTETSLTVSLGSGSIFTINTAPLLSITAAWTKNKKSK